MHHIWFSSHKWKALSYSVLQEDHRFCSQDDIVHGNLSVEENLRFSARCRLSEDMPKPDKVFVVERVIESLGLQAVSVGTVEVSLEARGNE